MFSQISPTTALVPVSTTVQIITVFSSVHVAYFELSLTKVDGSNVPPYFVANK